MSLRQKYVNILSRIVPAGAVGASLLLGSVAPSAADEHPAATQPSALDGDRIAERLAAIREAVSAVADGEIDPKPVDRNLRLAWGNWWNNWGWGGWGRPWGWPNWNNWRNWNNWNNWWRNW